MEGDTVKVKNKKTLDFLENPAKKRKNCIKLQAASLHHKTHNPLVPRPRRLNRTILQTLTF
jgi:fumarate reductase subunit C